jgi:fructan beta-fructosidase
VDRTRSGILDFHEGFAGVHSAELDPSDNKIRLHIFVDTSSVEVFANDGLVTFAECIFPAEASHGLELFVEDSPIKLCSLDVFQLQPVTFQLGGS